MRRIAGSDDLVRSVLLPPGPTEFKFVADGEWRYSPRDPVSSDQSSGTVNNCKTVQVNSSLSWRSTSPDQSIFVTGSFLAWSELVPLSYTSGGVYKAHCCLPVRCYLHATTCSPHIVCNKNCAVVSRIILSSNETQLTFAMVHRTAYTMYGSWLMALGRFRQICLQPKTQMAYPAMSLAYMHETTSLYTTRQAGRPAPLPTGYWTGLVKQLRMYAPHSNPSHCVDAYSLAAVWLQTSLTHTSAHGTVHTTAMCWLVHIHAGAIMSVQPHHPVQCLLNV